MQIILKSKRLQNNIASLQNVGVSLKKPRKVMATRVGESTFKMVKRLAKKHLLLLEFHLVRAAYRLKIFLRSVFNFIFGLAESRALKSDRKTVVIINSLIKITRGN